MVLCFLSVSLLRPLTSHSPTKDSTYVPEVPSQIGIEYTYVRTRWFKYDRV